MIFTTLVGICAAITAVAAILYVPARHKATKARVALFGSEGDAIVPAREKYWAADKRQKMLGLGGIAGYAIVMFSLVALQSLHVLEKGSTFYLWTMLTATAALLTVGITATIYNDKDTAARIKRDVERSYKPFDSGKGKS